MSKELDEINDLSQQSSAFDAAKAAARDWVKGKNIQELAVKCKELTAAKADKENELKSINAWNDVIRMEALPSKVEEMGLESPVKLEGIGRVSITSDVLVSVKGGMAQNLNQWLIDHGFGDLIKESVNSSTLKGFVKGRIVNGEEYPDQYLNVTPIEKASVLK